GKSCRFLSYEIIVRFPLDGIVINVFVMDIIVTYRYISKYIPMLICTNCYKIGSVPGIIITLNTV
ncbi:MAG: hypothetical protein J6M16_05660, partial [Clostridia bacterium]|nr:hypothetical protein [Clostridia bacterium]